MLVLGHSVRGQLRPPWPGVGRSPATVPASGQWVAWRLLGSNHREVARSASVFPDVRTCLVDVAEVRAIVAGAAGEVQVDAVGGLWGWALMVNGTPRAVAGRLYQRQQECDYHSRIFLASAAKAELLAAAPTPRDGSAPGMAVAAE